MAYADVEIHIRAKNAAAYPVDITVQTDDGKQEYLGGTFDPSASSGPGMADAGYADKEYGLKLFNWLFADPTLKQHWDTLSGEHKQRRIRLRIAMKGAPELHRYPWESLCEPDSKTGLRLAAAESTPFSRYTEGRWQPGKPIISRPVRMLVAVANPNGLTAMDPPLDPIETKTEWDALNKALQGVKGTSVELTLMKEPCTLQRLVEELRKGHYHILHLICHGIAIDSASSALYLADPKNDVIPVDDTAVAEQLALLLANTEVDAEQKLRMVFLASCQTAKRSAYDAFRGVAPQLVAAGVPAVLAMQDNVGIDAAREFAGAFYHRLFEDGQVDVAVNHARRWLLADAESGGSLQIAIPALFQRLQDGRLLGQRGMVSGGHTEKFWPSLLGSFDFKQCTVFLGPHVNTGLLSTSTEVAESLTPFYNYPLDDTWNLSHVARFADLTSRVEFRNRYVRELVQSLPRYLNLELEPAAAGALKSKTKFAEALTELQWIDRVRTIQEDEPHILLADLPIGLYITTTADSLMWAALDRRFAHIREQLEAEDDPDKREELEAQLPRRLQPYWQPAPDGSPAPPLKPAPDPDHRVVFHLNGFDEDPAHLVLSEDDYFRHLVRLRRDQDSLLPANVLSKLATDSLIFLGFRLDDWELRVILGGLLKGIARSENTPRRVGVQLAPNQATNEVQARSYLQDYMNTHLFDIYWGEAREFVNELHSRFRHYRETGDAHW